MANRFIFAALFFLYMVPVLQAQDHDPPRFTQRLSWIEDKHALRYEVIIEKEEGEAYQRVRQEITRALSIEVSLPPGRYRYGVIPYDLLNRPAQEPVWRIFDVLAALAPELNYCMPELLYLDQDADLALNVFGRNLLPNAEIYLRSLDNENIFPVPKSADYNGNPANEVRLTFDSAQFVPGTYEIHVTNPGGLKTSMAGLNVVERKQAVSVKHRSAAPSGDTDMYNYYISAAWMPLFPIFGEMMEQYFGEGLYPLGVIARFGVISDTQSFLNAGLELAVSWYSVSASLAEYESNIQSTSVETIFVLQKPFFQQQIALTLRIGMGVVLQRGSINALSNGMQLWSLDRQIVHVILGGSLIFLTSERLYMEMGLDYPYMFYSEFPLDYFRPWIGIGLRF